MHDCLILGTGRSGTSMVAGCLARSGYHQGAGLHLPRAANPKGFFESPLINSINEALLSLALEGHPDERRFQEGQRWLAIAPALAREVPEQLQEHLRAAAAERPFAYKDPRFCFTLPAWRPHLGDVRQLVVFRDPRLTARSMAEECKAAPYLMGLELDEAHFLALWTAAYRRVLEASDRGHWHFVHYDQVLDSSALDGIQAFLDAPVDREFPDPKLFRPAPAEPLPRELQELYQELCERAGYRQSTAPRAAKPRVAGLGRVQNQAELLELIDQTQRIRGVELELYLVGPTGAELELPGSSTPATQLWRDTGDSEGRAVERVLAASSAPYLAILDPQVEVLPGALLGAVQALEHSGKDLATTDFYLSDDHGQFVSRSNPSLMGNAPGPRFEAGLVGRREAFFGIATADCFPALRARHVALEAAGRVVHAEEPGRVLSRRRYVEQFAHSRILGQLVALHGQPGPRQVRPRLTVSLCTFNRRKVLAECLGALSRQSVPPGTFELVLVDDGSTDGTAEYLAGLELPIPHRFLRQENAGLAAARNFGLGMARGEFVLFINDDTIADPTLIERHLAAHRELGRPAAVLGNFRQSKESLGNALMRVLEAGDLVFDFAKLAPGQACDGLHFFTCNVSAPLAAIRAVGGFDPSFRHYGCEDSDLGLRLEAQGVRVHFFPDAGAEHRHFFDLDYLRQRARTVGCASVHLMRKHPALVERWGNHELTRDFLNSELERQSETLERLEAFAAQLARIDLDALERVSPGSKTLAQSLETRLTTRLPELHRLWFWQGYLIALEQHGIEDFSMLVSAASARPLDGPQRLAAAPDWSDAASLDALIQATQVAGEGVLWQLLVGAGQGSEAGSAQQAGQALEAAFERYNGSRAPEAEPSLDVLLWPRPAGTRDWLRLESEVDAWYGAPPESALQQTFRLRLERLQDPAALRAWRERFLGPDQALALGPPLPPPKASRWSTAPVGLGAGPELSVIVPSADRPEALQALLQALAAQSLEPSRFEVLVVDDGSKAPLEPILAGLQVPFNLRLWTQRRSGPAVARNRALREARGEWILFLNDDALPSKDLLRSHLEIQRGTIKPIALLGRFSLLPKWRDHTLAEYLETSTSLFAQPLMQPGVHYRGLSLCTGNLSIHRTLLEGVGGFDEGFPEPGGEDSELGFRLERELDVQVRYEPALACEHDHDLDIDSLWARKRTLGRSVSRIQEKHGDLGLTGELPWPLTPESLKQLAADQERQQPALQNTLSKLRRLKQRERETGKLAADPATTRSLIQSVEQLGFQAGLLEAALSNGSLEQIPPALSTRGWNSAVALTGPGLGMRVSLD